MTRSTTIVREPRAIQDTTKQIQRKRLVLPTVADITAESEAQGTDTEATGENIEIAEITTVTIIEIAEDEIETTTTAVTKFENKRNQKKKLKKGKNVKLKKYWNRPKYKKKLLNAKIAQSLSTACI